MALNDLEKYVLNQGARGGSPDKWGSRRPGKGSAVVAVGNKNEAIEYLKAEAKKLGKIVTGIQESIDGGMVELRFDLRAERTESVPWTHKGGRTVPRGSSTGGGSTGIRGGFGEK